MQKKGESQRSWALILPADRRFDVLCLGENSIDVLATVPHWPSANEKLELISQVTMPGGQAATAAVGCARLGCRTHYLGTFGDDEPARIIEAALRAEGVETSGSRVARAPNRSAFIIVNPAAGTRAVLWQRDAALVSPEISVFTSAVSAARLLLVDCTDIAASTEAARAAKASGVPVILDVDRTKGELAQLLPHVDVLIGAEGFAESHTGQRELGRAMRGLQQAYHMAAVVVTLGAEGAVAWDGAQEVRSPGFVVPVVDPTGAGDAFRAGFMAAWIHASAKGQGGIGEYLAFANATAALNCRRLGAQAGLPTRAEVLGLLTAGVPGRSNQTGPATEAGQP